MMRTAWFWIVLTIGAAAIVAAGVGLDRFGLDSPRSRAEARQEALRELREHLDRCLGELERVEERFWAHEAYTHGLRARIEEYESLDPEGVPMDRYGEYLEVFDGYNEAIPVWEARADSLTSMERRCRELAERYNEERETLRRFLADEGLGDDP